MVWRSATALLLGVAAVATLIRVADSSTIGRAAGVLAAFALVGVAVAVLRAQVWGYGLSFLLALCWLWAAVGLGVQGALGATEILVWLAWSVVVMIASVRARAT